MTTTTVAPQSVMTANRAALLASLGGIYLWTVALPTPDLMGLAVPYLLEGKVTFSPRLIHASSAALTFALIILIRSLVLWTYGRWAQRRRIFRVNARFSTSVFIWTLAALLVGVAMDIVMWRLDPSPHMGLYWGVRRWYGTAGALTFVIMQFLYYFSEGLAMIWLVDAFQNAGEIRWPALRSFPWGGIALALLWGGAHYFTKDLQTALSAMPIGLVAGVFFVLGKRSLWPCQILWMIACAPELFPKA